MNLEKQHCSSSLTIKGEKKRCGRKFYARVNHKLCRACYKALHGEPRPIGRVYKARTTSVKHTPVAETKTSKKKK